MENIERKIMDIITISGEGKLLAFEALKLVKTDDFKKAKELLEDARAKDLEAHNIQTEIIQESLKDDADDSILSLLMIHAQDHYMTSQSTKDLVEVLIDVFEEERKRK
jgi:PTS system cellobiose-specific IIA component